MTSRELQHKMTACWAALEDHRLHRGHNQLEDNKMPQESRLKGEKEYSRSGGGSSGLRDCWGFLQPIVVEQPHGL